MTKMQKEKNAKNYECETNNFISKYKMKWTLHQEIEIMQDQKKLDNLVFDQSKPCFGLPSILKLFYKLS